MIHTFVCHGCDIEFQREVPARDMPRMVPCPNCEGECKKLFTVNSLHVIPDTLKRRFKAASLAGTPVCESRSDIKRAMKRHDEKYGTKLIWD